MKKAIFAGFVLSAAVLAGVATAGASSGEVADQPYADNSVVVQHTSDATSGQGT